MSRDKPKGTDAEAFWLDRRANRNRTHFARHPSRRERSRERALRDWYGDDEQASHEVLAHQSPARPLNEVLPAALSHISTADSMLLGELRASWAVVVGADVAKRSRPVALDRRIVQVEVADSTWRYVLEQERKADIAERIREFTDDRITGLSFIPPGRQARTADG